MTLSRPALRTRDDILNALSNSSDEARLAILQLLDVVNWKLDLVANLEEFICALDLLKDRRHIERVAILNDLLDRFDSKRLELVPRRTEVDDTPAGFERRRIPAHSPGAVDMREVER